LRSPPGDRRDRACRRLEIVLQCGTKSGNSYTHRSSRNPRTKLFSAKGTENNGAVDSSQALLHACPAPLCLQGDHRGQVSRYLLAAAAVRRTARSWGKSIALKAGGRSRRQEQDLGYGFNINSPLRSSRKPSL